MMSPLSRCAVLTILLLLLGTTSYAQQDDNTNSRTTQDLFQARDAGDIEVKLIPKDATRATVIITNKTDRPLRIALPGAFAGVPALAQMGGMGQGMGGMGQGMGGMGGGMGMGMQSFGGGMGGGMGGMGGGMGGMGGGMGGMGGGGGFFNLKAESAKKIRVATVCLEHGKQDPNPRIAYTMVPLQQFTDDPQVAMICSMLGRNEIDQISAQAAAWHVVDGLSWEELANKVKVRHLNGSVDMFFTPAHVEQAMRIVYATAQSVREAPVTVTTPVPGNDYRVE